MLTLLLACCTTLALGTWTVDDDGPADFDQIGTAVAAVAAGDVLHVEPGTYVGFTLDKRMTILGRAGGARPHVTGIVRLQAAAGFTFARFDTDVVFVTDVSGRSRIDDCTVGVVKDLPQRFAVSVSGCAQVLISRTTIRGSTTFNLSPATQNGGGLHVSASRLTLVDSDVRGAKGASPTPSPAHGGNGGPGVVVISDSHVVIAGCAMVRGGEEGWGSVPFTPSTDGKAGDGLVVDHSTVVVRGTLPDALLPGFYSPEFGGTPGKSLVAADASRVVVSGVNFSPMWTVSGDSVLLQPAVAEPYLVSTGGDAPGTAHALQLYGPEGVPALLGISLAPALVTLQGFDDPVWVDPGAPLLYLLPIVTAGQATPIELAFTMPAAGLGLEGTVAEAQAFFPTFPSSLQPGLGLATNAAQVIVRL